MQLKLFAEAIYFRFMRNRSCVKCAKFKQNNKIRDYLFEAVKKALTDELIFFYSENL